VNKIPKSGASQKYTGETDITPAESYLLTGGPTRLSRGAWIVSISYLGWSLFAPTIAPVFSFLKSAIAFFSTPALWLSPLKIWPGVPALPSVSLVLLACAVVLAMISIAGVCIIRPILKFALMKRRYEAIAGHIGLAGRATYEISEDGVLVWNQSGAGERLLRFGWGAFDEATNVKGFIRLSYHGKPLAHIALRAFGGEAAKAHAFILNAIGRSAPAAHSAARTLEIEPLRDVA